MLKNPLSIGCLDARLTSVLFLGLSLLYAFRRKKYYKALVILKRIRSGKELASTRNVYKLSNLFVGVNLLIANQLSDKINF